MGARKSVDLGGGLRKEVSYEELKHLLRSTNPVAEQKVLKKHFPDEFSADREAAHAAQLARFSGDRWKAYLGETPPNSNLKPYRYSHQDIVKLVRGHHPHRGEARRQNRVTDFTNWIFEAIYRRSDPDSQKAGKEGERDIAVIKRSLRASDYSNWRLIDRDPLEGTPNYREISLLKIGDESLFGAPDYVFHNQQEDTILIVEIKVSNRPFPSDAWPNLRAQLWAYGNIDHYVNLATKIVLVGEIWRRVFNVATREKNYCLGETYRREMSDAVFCEQNEELFEIYKNYVLRSRAAD